MSDLVLRPLGPGDEEAARAAHRELATEGFSFLLGWDPSLPWSDYLAELELHRRGEALPPGWVPGTFLVAEVDGELVGRVSLRHELNDFLRELGGHVGYAVRPAFRRLGYATAMLGAALDLATSLGLERVLVTCDVTNVGSAAVIERCGGVLQDVRPDPTGPAKRRYWVPLP